MEIRQIEYFVEVAKCRNFTRAAENLLVAQPAISKSIAKLEQEIGLSLIDRSSKHISLTPEGDVFYRHALGILDRIREATIEMNEMRGLQKGEIRIGLPSMIGSYYFPQYIREFKRAYQSLQITVVEEGTVQIQKLIERKEVDLGIIVLDHISDEIEYFPLLKEEMVVCVPKDHPFSKKESVSYHDLIQEPLILFKEGYFQRQIVVETSRQTGLKPNVTFSSNQLSLIKSLVSEGLGITLFLKMVVENDAQFVSKSLEPPVYLQIAIAWNKNAYLSMAGQAFLDFLKGRN